MATPSARLAELGIALPPVAAPVAAYVPAVVHGGYAWTSGQLPFVDGELRVTGRVGEDLSEDDAATLARVAALNGLAAIAEVAGGVDRIARIVRVVGYVSSGPHFFGQPRVINGASEVLAEIFGDDGRHARSAVGVAALPLNSPVEVEIHAALRD